MRFEVKKTNNCFSDAETYEYKLPIDGDAFLALLPPNFSSRKNLKLRRPVFFSESETIRIRGMLAFDIIRVSFPSASLIDEKEKFEAWLGDVIV